MLPVPEQPRPGNLPWVCLAFFAIGLTVFLTVQRDDEAREQALATWYQESGLFALEWPNYISWLRINGNAELASGLEAALRHGDRVEVLRHMGHDPAFAQENRVRGDQYWSAREQLRWQRLREEFLTRSRTVVSHHYGLTPAAPRPGTWLTWHFLQSSFTQWLVALLVALPFIWPLEAELGKRRVAILWLLTGAVTGLGYVAFMGDSYRPLIGSTSMASALVGMYLGLFARRRLPFRWFHPREKRWRTTHLPAIVAAPVWLVLPLWAWLSGDTSPGLWLAQLLALPAGAGLVHLVRRDETDEDADESEEEEEAGQQLRRHLATGWNSMSALDFREAEAAFEAALSVSPGHFHALTGLYHIRKLNPDSEAFRETALRVFGAPVESDGDIRQQLTLYRDFQRRCQDQHLPAEVAVLLMMRFTRVAELRDAEQLAQGLMKQREAHPLLAKALAALASAFEQFHDDARASRFRALAENLAN